MTSFRIETLELDPEIISAHSRRDQRFTNWPVVYTLNNDTHIYVGESLNASARMRQHLESVEKAVLKSVRVVLDDTFNKSACLDLESYLIQLFAGDGKYRVLNRNDGIVDGDYYGRHDYRETFEAIVEELRKHGAFLRSPREIENNNLYKLSPYKALNGEQLAAVRLILDMLIDDLTTGEAQPLVIQGEPGTGKTIVAIFVIKLIMDIAEMTLDSESGSDSELSEYFNTENHDRFQRLRIGLVIPQQSLRTTVKSVFRKTAGLREEMVLSVNDVGESSEGYDVLLVDETHRLGQRANQSSGSGNRRFAEINERLFGQDDLTFTQLDWIVAQSKHQILMVDPSQSVRPADLPREVQRDLIKGAKDQGRCIVLFSQMRVAAGDDYVDYVRRLLTSDPPKPQRFVNYELRMYDDVKAMHRHIIARNDAVGLARLVAGFAWEWKSKKDKGAFDIDINGYQLRWNSSDTDWISKSGSVNEVGSIHTVQGYDLNYAGVIIGPELGYDDERGCIVFRRERYMDKKGKENNPRRGIRYSDDDVLNFVVGAYGVLLTRGVLGTYVYVCDPKLRDYLKRYVF
ncbi:DNA/RNA helicase domain-containing protein [Ferrimicrobium sp.]|uniref:DNA/RNA helicase domain-containing protein n=1 Tax=Ferrimicrobium sp. TaxID=2926050 RepID=UPI002630594A|nr:DNA/RNA helicase domain-containing protein [Ferrimicrobium sp.]